MNTAVHQSQRFDHPVEDVVRYYRHGWHSWSPSGWRDPSDQGTAPIDAVRAMGTEHPDHDHGRAGSGMMMVEHADGSVTLMGALGPGAWVELDSGCLRGSSEGAAVGWMVVRGEEAAVLARYREALAAAYDTRSPAPQRVWCSWYGLYEEINEALLHEITADLSGLTFDVVQVDDGWQHSVGDWEPNGKFPSGMADLASRIGSVGFVPGLWLAPFIAVGGAEPVARFPEFLARDRAGAAIVAGVNWGEPYYALDLSHPGVQEHVVDTIRRIRSWGYRYLKLDFLYPGALPGGYAGDPELQYRKAIALIREAAGEDCYLLGCGAPIFPSLGIFDGVRIGPDVAEWWFDPAKAEGTRNAVETCAGRLWMRDLIDVDPDVAFFRSRQLELSPQATDVLRDLGRISGFRGSSDPPAWLADDERAQLAAYLREQPEIHQAGRNEWTIDGRAVDLSQSFSKIDARPRRNP